MKIDWNETTKDIIKRQEKELIQKHQDGFSKREILLQILKGDEESLGWKAQHYSGAIAKILYNQRYGGKEK